MNRSAPPTHADVRDAAGRIAGLAHRTPVLTSRTLDSASGATVFLKAENFQRVGAFKFRGAVNALSRLPSEVRRRGVVAYSSGNHAQAVALAARELDMPATIVMPYDAPAAKRAATEGYGARVIAYDRYAQDPAAIAGELAEDDDATFLPPFNHPDIIAGQGTAALELIEETGDLDVLLVPLGGGGLLSGTALAVRDRVGRLIGVEPAAGDDGRQSVEAGRIITIPTPSTIADGAQTTSLGDLTFPLISRLVDEIRTAEDDELAPQMRFFASRMKIVVEPTGVLAAAALAAAQGEFAGARVGVILSGGNVDPERFASLLSGPAEERAE